jgi:Ca2+-binding EF-hand superfamily protein
MNKLYLRGAAAAAILIGGAALAQQAPAPAPAPQMEMRMHHEMKPMTRAEVVAHVRDMFAKLDSNKDGFITREEAEAARGRMAGDMRERFAQRLAERGAGMAMPDRGAIFDRLDKNHDGMISRDEFMSAEPVTRERRIVVMRDGEGAMPGQPGMYRMRTGMGMGLHGRMFDMADTNKDGRVSLQEATAVALQHFDAADLNHDGILTPEERMQAHQQLRGQRQPS